MIRSEARILGDCSQDTVRVLSCLVPFVLLNLHSTQMELPGAPNPHTPQCGFLPSLSHPGFGFGDGNPLWVRSTYSSKRTGSSTTIQ